MEYLSSLATEVVLKIGGYLLGSVVEQCEHLHPDRSINNLREEYTQLKGMKQALQGQVVADRNNGRIIADNVEKWLHKVEGVEAELQPFFEDEANKKNQWRRYSLSKIAAKKRAIVQILKDEGQKFPIISSPAPPPRAADIFTAHIKGFQSRTNIITDVIEKLKSDEFQRISICGMGGVGKTTMAKQVIKIAEDNKLFDGVAITVVSQNVNYEWIQGNIAEGLGLQLENKTPEGRAGEILRRLKSLNKVLIVLDDVWTELDFERIGLPADIEYHKGCKILFTSRNQHECAIMGSQKNFNISVLSSDEAWELFKEMAGSDTCDKPDIEPIAKEVANECGGLPLAIVTVGKMLLNEEKYTWEDVLSQLKTSPVASWGSQDSAYSRIKVSYDFLDSEEHKDCLLLCCLFPEDFDIPIEVLMRHGLGLGLFKGAGNLLAARKRVLRLVDKLKDRFLLLNSEKKGCVKMHDIVRDTIIWIGSMGPRGHNVQGGVEIERPKGGASDYKAISLILDKSNELPIGFNYSNYQVLQVESKEVQTVPCPENLLQGMAEVKVLSLRKLYISRPPSLFRALHNLRTLRLEKCEVGDTSIIGMELPSLEILSFVSSNIGQLPLEIGRLNSLKLLDLSECNNLYKIHPNVLPSLSCLEELYIRVDNFPWQQNKAILAELKPLSHHLKVFEIRVKKFEILPKDLVFDNLEWFWFLVGAGHFEYDLRSAYLHSNRLEIQDVDCNSINCSLLTKQLVQKCEILDLAAVEYLRNLNIIHGIDEKTFPNLKALGVKSCNDLEFLVAEKSMVEFSNLVELKLNYLPNLSGFVESKVSEESEQSISSVEELKGNEIVGDEPRPTSGKLFTCDWKQQFPKLQEISLEHCDSLDTLFDLQEYSKLVGQEVPRFFPQMKEIKIYSLSKLRHVWSNVPPNVQGFENLKQLKIERCGSLRYLFFPFIVSALKQLERVEIDSCDSMEELLSNGTINKKAETIEFFKLVYLKLRGLPRLVSFCSDSDFELVWPSLKELVIENCPELNPIQIQKAIARQENPMVSADIGSGAITSEKSSTKFLDCCFGYASKSSNKASSPMDHVPSVEEMGSSLYSSIPILQHIKIHDCNSMDTIFSHSKRMNTDSFSRVESLDLRQVPNLVCFCQWDSPSLDNKFEFTGASDEGGTRIRLVPFMDGFLFLNLSSLVIRSCHKMSSLFSPSSSASLKCLKKLDIKDCDSIEEIVWGEKEIQTSGIVFPELRVLKLKRLGNFRCFGSYYHLEFPSLEEVSIIDCPNIEELPCGSSNTPKLQDVTLGGKNHKMKYMRQRDLNAIIRQYKALQVVLQTSETLRWNEVDQGVTSCSLKNHEKLLKVIPFDGIQKFYHLKELSILKCISLVEVFESEGVLDWDMKKKDFELVKIELKELPNLIHIWKSLISGIVSFTNLRELQISECHRLTDVLPFSLAQNLVQLQYLRVEECNMIEDIVIQKDGESEGINNKVKIIFPELKELYLHRLPKLKCFCSAACDFELRSCDKMVIEKCPNMTTFSCGTVSTPKLSQVLLQKDYNIWGRPIAYTMGDLNSTIYYIYNASVFEEQMQNSQTLGWIEHDKLLLNYVTRVIELNLRGNENLLNCIPSNMMHIFQHLRKLNVEECDSVVEIFESEGVDADNKEHGIMPYHLEFMCLRSLPELASIWKSHHASILGFQNLETLEIKSCNSLKSVFPLSIAKSLPNLLRLEVSNCEMMEEIVAFKTDEGDKISQEPNETKVMTFPWLAKLFLTDLPNLKRFCAGPCDLELSCCQRMIIENCRKMESFCHGITFTPILRCLSIEGTEYSYPVEEGLDAIIPRHYKIEEQMQKLQAFRGIEHNEPLLGYVTRVTQLNIRGNENLLNCVPSNMMHIFKHLTKLDVKECDSIIEIFESMGVDADIEEQDIMSYELREMCLYSLPELASIWKSHHASILGFQNLEALEIKSCHSLKSVFPLSIAKSLPMLEWLEVSNCEMMEEIVEFKTDEGDKISQEPNAWILGFQNLKTLEIKSCHSLKSVFPLSIAKSLPYLNTLEVSNCEMIEEIVAFKTDEGDKISQELNETKVMAFPRLDKLFLTDLPNLKRFCAGPCDLELPHCERVTIDNCRKMESFCHGITFTPILFYLSVEGREYLCPVEEGLDAIIQSHHQSEEQMQKLQTFRWIEHDELLLGYVTRVIGLTLRGYKNLLNCVPSNMMRKFQHLIGLNVEECDSVVEIFESEGEDADNEEHDIMPYQLQKMRLQSLPELASIWKSHHASILGFQNLKILEIKSCHNLKSVFPLSIAKSLPNLGRLEISDCQMIEEIVAFKTDEGDKISEEPNETKVMTFPRLITLHITDLPNLKRFCAGPCDLQMPKCWWIFIENCRKMESFCHGITSTRVLPFLSVEGTKYECPIEEGLEAIIQSHYQSQNAEEAEAEKQPSPAI